MESTKRSQERIKFSVAMSVRRAGSQAWMGGRSRDISTRGIGFTVDEPIRIGERILLKVASSIGEVFLDATVRHVRFEAGSWIAGASRNS